MPIRLHLPLYEVRTRLGISRYGFGEQIFPEAKLYGYSFRQLDRIDARLALRESLDVSFGFDESAVTG